MLVQGWITGMIIGQATFPISCSVRKFHRQFKVNQFDCSKLLMERKRKPNGCNKCRGKGAFKHTTSELFTVYPEFQPEFGNLEGVTIIVVYHKSTIVSPIERF